MALLRLLQISDLHLGRPFAWLPPERRELRRRDQQTALEQVIKHAIERDAHAILVPGDLFDGVPVDTGSLTFAVRAFSVPGCPPVFIAPGNHDPASNDNAAWNARLLHARGTHWPSHVHIFDQPRWTSVELESMPGVRIWGRAFLTSSGTMERPLSKQALDDFTPRTENGIDIAVFHGSREGRCPPAQKITGPFSDAEVTASPFHYHAVGHYHARSEFEQLSGEGTPSSGVRLAYAGSPIALDYTEPGDHGALEVLVRYGLDGCVVGADPHKLDRRTLHAFAAAGVTQHDFTKLTLIGRLSPGVRWTAPGADVFARAFHVRWDRGAVRPDYELDALRSSEGRTTEERFARDLLTRIDSEEDPEQRVALERALFYGLDAFRVREVVPQWEEVSEP